MSKRFLAFFSILPGMGRPVPGLPARPAQARCTVGRFGDSPVRFEAAQRQLSGPGGEPRPRGDVLAAVVGPDGGDLDAKRPAEFAAVVFKDNRDKFPPSLKDAYVGKTVQLRGMVSTFQNKPQMVLSDPAQITILEKRPDP